MNPWKTSSGGIMNFERDQQSQFNYDEWISRLLQNIATAQNFLTGFIQAAKVLFKKGLIVVWKEIRTTASKLSAADLFLAGMNITVGLLGVIILLAGIGLLGYQSTIVAANRGLDRISFTRQYLIIYLKTLFYTNG